MTISFAGHASIPSSPSIKEAVKEQIYCLLDSQHMICYLGGYGDFDRVCAQACRELKQERADIELVYVTPYMNLREQKKLTKLQHCDHYDAIIYPPIESTPPKFAISKRDEWMVTNADVIIAYVEHNFGGAYRSLQIAKRRKKKIINIYDLLRGC